MQIGREYGFFRDFTQGDDGIFIPVAIDGQFRAARNLPRALSGEQDEVKAVGNLVDTIFDGNAGQTGLLQHQGGITSWRGSSTPRMSQ